MVIVRILGLVLLLIALAAFGHEVYEGWARAAIA